MHNFTLVNADTDSISFCKSDQSKFNDEEMEKLLKEINSYMDEKIVWEDDGIFKKVLIVKAKNYVLERKNKERTIKGSALKATTKEKAFQAFIKDCIELLLHNKRDHLFSLYNKYVYDILNIKDIHNWCSKKTVTDKVLNPKRTNEQRVLDAIGDKVVQEGDKIYVFFEEKEKLCLRENFTGLYSVDTLLKKLYKNLDTFENLIDVSLFPDYSLKRNKGLLDEIDNSGK